MKKMVGSIRYGLASLRRRAGEILKDEEGMGTVEVILIILDIDHSGNIYSEEDAAMEFFQYG